MSVKKNLSYNIIYQILTIMLPLVTAPYLSRVIGVEGIGVYSYTYSQAHYFILIAMLGLNNYGNRTIATVRDNKDKLNTTFWSIYFLQLITSLIMLIGYIFFIGTLDSKYRVISNVQTLLVISAIFDINWFFFGIEQFKLTVTRNAVVRIVTTILIFTFVKDENDLFIYSLILAIGTLLSQCMLWFYIRKFINFYMPNLKEIAAHFKPNLILFIPILSVSIYRTMDKIMIGSLSNMQEAAFYANTDKIVTLPLVIITALGTVMLPRMSNMIALGEDKKAKKMIRDSMQFAIFLSIGMMFGMLAIAERFAPIYFGESFKKCGELIGLMSPIIVFSSIASVIRTQYLIPYGNDKSYIISVTLGAMTNIIINLLLIPPYGALGGVIGTLVAEFMVMFYQIMSVRKKLEINQYVCDNWIFIFAGIGMYSGVIFIGNITNNSIIVLCFQIILGVLMYGIISFILYVIFNKKRMKYLIRNVHLDKIINKMLPYRL